MYNQPYDSEQRDELQAGKHVSPPAPVRAHYGKPELTLLGDLRSFTLAPSPGEFESGPGEGFRG